MCGLIGVTGSAGAAKEVFLGLMNLQHRGQDGAGILTVSDLSGGQFNIQKGSGLVENVFSESSFKILRGTAAIGHSRYATVGSRDPNLLQPFLDCRVGLGIAHNGNIVNCIDLGEKLSRDRKIGKASTDSDSELILQLLSDYLFDKDTNSENIFAAIDSAMKRLVGSYAVVGLVEDGGLFGFRDPNGIRPLVFGKKEGIDGKTMYAIASETVALDYLGYRDLEEIQHGEAIYICPEGRLQRKMLRQETNSPCMFEWVYFARVESVFGGMPVYKARFKLGLLLADELMRQGLVADVVVPVPETSRAAAIAIAESMNLPFRELLIKNRYVQRTFILDDQEARKEAIRRKLFPIASEIKGKRCLVVDDSIVRGNTARKIIEMLRQSGAREVILVSTCPPIANPCFYGIDFPSRGELIACGRSEAEIAETLGADRVVYLSYEGLKEALSQKSLCTGCLTNEYPTDVSQGEEFELKRLQDREGRIAQST